MFYPWRIILLEINFIKYMYMYIFPLSNLSVVEEPMG